jgi:hypothetical protein
MNQDIGLNIKPGDWFIADIIGQGIYELVESGINSGNMTYAIVKLKKLFCRGFADIGHETTCHPINVERWNKFKMIRYNPETVMNWINMELSEPIKKQQEIIKYVNACFYNYSLTKFPDTFQGLYPNGKNI